MYFKRLEMHGFKSFAEPVAIDFHEGITCIVGPNGSGKSNISDAIRWVLGEQSPGALRGGKMEEVIFSGSDARKSRGMAEVTLVIDNSGGLLDTDYSEVAITRRMFRSGESEYLINNNRCRLRDIRDLITDTGIGVEGYSIIGQGRIADIVGSRPESRREVFEEAAGIVLYKNRKAEAERKLGSASGNLERACDIISEIEGRIGGLREESARAEEYLELKEKYRHLETNIILRNTESLLSKNQIYKDDISRIEKETEAALTRKERGIREAEEKVREGSRLEAAENGARDSLFKTAGEISRIQSRSELDRERLAGIERDSLRLDGEIRGLEEKLKEGLKNKETLEKSRERILLERKDAEAALKEAVLRRDRLDGEMENESDMIEEKRERLFELHSLISSKRSTAKSYGSIKKALVKRSEQLRKEAAGAEEGNREIAAGLKEAEEKRDRLKKALEETAKGLKESEKEKERLSQRQRELYTEGESIRLQWERVSERKKTVAEMERNYEGYSFAVRFVMKAGLPGIKGAVSDLAKVPEGFEAAVEAALGSRLQNIVCDTDAAAKRAINLLKEKRAGRLTFLPVASVRGERTGTGSGIARSEGFLGIGSDIVGFDPEYRSIFEYLLGRVAIVKDMDCAVSLSKKGRSSLRFVTLDGEVVSPGGAITGGRYKNSTASFLERKNEIQQLEKKAKELSESLSGLLEEQRRIGGHLEDIKEGEERAQKDRREKEISLASVESSVSALRKNLSDHESSGERFDRKYGSIFKEISDVENMIACAEKEAAGFEREIVSVREWIGEALTARDGKKSLAEKAGEEASEARVALKDRENREENCKELLSGIEEALKDHGNLIRSKKAERETLEKEKEIIVARGKEDRLAAGGLIIKKQQTEDLIRAISAERKELGRALESLKKETEEAAGIVNRCRDLKYQTELKSAKIEAQINSLKERLWDEFEISYAQAADQRAEGFVMAAGLRESRAAKDRLRELGEVNAGAIKEYAETSRRYKFLTEQRDDILKGMKELQKIIGDTDRAIRRKFRESFDGIRKNFGIIFKELFGGGYAELCLEDESAPLESGIQIIAQPPGKKLQNISLMSGGEKTMTAIALMFAILKTKPAPFCIFDEVETALDDINIERFTDYLRKFSHIQFALVTHRKATMKHADVLYGVTMAELGVSKVLSLKLDDDFEV